MMRNGEALEIVSWDTDRIYLKKSSGSDPTPQGINDRDHGEFIVIKEKISR
jgi:hypothetical protein